MSARIAKQRTSTKNHPKIESSSLDELDDYIRYQDEVLDRNADELIGVVEDQENKIRLLQKEQDGRMQKLYEKDDLMDTLDADLQKLIQITDQKMSQRMMEMDKKTEDYMKDLAKRNAQWSIRLKEVGANVTASARAKGSVIWDERQGQKGINKSYVPFYKIPREEGDVVWDAETIAAGGGTASSNDTVVEVMSPKEQEQFIKREQERIRKKTSGAKPAKKKRSPPAKKKAPAQQKRRPEYKIGTAQTRTTRTQRKRSAPTKKGEATSYPCPTCQNSLVYYDKYQRWWCRSCKKWR